MTTHKVYTTYNGLNCTNIIKPYHWYMVPKTGRTSLLYWLNQNECLNPDFKVWSKTKKYKHHLPPWVFDSNKIQDRKNLNKLDTLFTFAFIRNPFDRLVSAFFNKTKNVKRKHRLEFYERFEDKTFEEFAHILCDKINYQLDRHVMPQNEMIPDKLDFVGRFENYNEDAEKVCQIIANRSFDKRQANQSEHEHYTKYYKSQDLKDKVYNKYIEDFRRFNYEF